MTARPGCGRDLPIPSLDEIIIDLLDASPLSEAAEDVLRALWARGGLPVRFHVVHDAVFAWDADGGPDDTKARKIINAAVAELNAALATTPLRVHRVHAAWRLTIELPR